MRRVDHPAVGSFSTKTPMLINSSTRPHQIDTAIHRVLAGRRAMT